MTGSISSYKKVDPELEEKFHINIISKLIARRIFKIVFTRDPNIPVQGNHVIKDEKNIDTLIETLSKQVSELEDIVILSGASFGFACLGLEGLTTLTGRSTLTSEGSWPKYLISDIENAIEIIGESTVPPIMILPLKFAGLMDFNSKQNNYLFKSFRALLKETCLSDIFFSDNLFTANGGKDSAVIMSNGADVATIEVNSVLGNFKLLEYQTPDPEDETKKIDWISVINTSRLVVNKPEKVVELQSIEIDMREGSPHFIMRGGDRK